MNKAKDIIARSILMHPSLFADSLRAQQITHNAYAVNETACKLHCIPPHVRTDAAVDWDEQYGSN